MHTRTHHRGVPLPAVASYDWRLRLECILVEVIEDEAVYPVSRKRALATNREQLAAMVDNLHLIRGTDITRRFGATFDSRLGKYLGILPRLDDALHTTIKLRGKRTRVRSDSNTHIGVEPKHIGREQRCSTHTLAVLRRHRDNQFRNTTRSKCLEHSVVGTMKRCKIKEGIYPLSKIRKGTGWATLRTLRLAIIHRKKY